jgi:hypothetical protein
MRNDGKSILQLGLNALLAPLEGWKKKIDLDLGSANMGLERLLI